MSSDSTEVGRATILCTTELPSPGYHACTLWHYGLWSFQTWDTKLDRFLTKNQHNAKEIIEF